MTSRTILFVMLALTVAFVAVEVLDVVLFGDARLTWVVVFPYIVAIWGLGDAHKAAKAKECQ